MRLTKQELNDIIKRDIEGKTDEEIVTYAKNSSAVLMSTTLEHILEVRRTKILPPVVQLQLIDERLTHLADTLEPLNTLLEKMKISEIEKYANSKGNKNDNQ